MCDDCKYFKNGYCYHPNSWYEEENPSGDCSLYEFDEAVYNDVSKKEVF